MTGTLIPVVAAALICLALPVTGQAPPPTQPPGPARPAQRGPAGQPRTPATGQTNGPLRGVPMPATLHLAELPCDYGASDVTRTYTVTNTFGSPIPAGTTIWAESASETPAGKVSLTLEMPLAPGATDGLILPGGTSGGRCRAWFDPGKPDLKMVSAELVKFEGPTGGVAYRAKVRIKNNNPFRPAPASTTMVEFMPCGSGMGIMIPDPIGSVMIPTGAIPRDGTIEINHLISPPELTRWLRAQADAAGAIDESSEVNNTSANQTPCSPYL